MRNRTVIDVGANIGNTAIYFALKGAKKVIAIEPVPTAFKYLFKNIASNNVGNVIFPMNIGIGKSEDAIKIKDEEMDVTGIYVHDEGDGKTVKITTLTNLIKENKLGDNLVLKMDCEGCEFDSLLNEDENTLKAFSEIIMEYHNYPYDLIKTLLSLNFEVTVNDVNIIDLTKIPRKILRSHIGYIYAKQL